jgi:predicted nucleotide-binding protein
MKSRRVQIEYIQNQLLFSGEEFVLILNGTRKKYDLKGWKLIYENISTGALLYTHHFQELRGSFDPGERLCVISGKGTDEFNHKNAERRFPVRHWDLHTKTAREHLLNLPRVRVRLIDDAGTILDTMTVERLHAATSAGSAVKARSSINVFIGHGRNPQWRALRDHLQDHHQIRTTAYEVRPRAGLGVKEVLEKMLSEASFAVLVLTSEDFHRDGTGHARENVVHELGLFQGHLGFRRAVALLEEGVKEFSNISGINQIRFSKGNIRETFGDLLATIRREFKTFR